MASAPLAHAYQWQLHVQVSHGLAHDEAQRCLGAVRRLRTRGTIWSRASPTCWTQIYSGACRPTSGAPLAFTLFVVPGPRRSNSRKECKLSPCLVSLQAWSASGHAGLSSSPPALVTCSHVDSLAPPPPSTADALNKGAPQCTPVHHTIYTSSHLQASHCYISLTSPSLAAPRH